MDLELSDDQFALRDGIAALLAGRFPIERVREGFDRAQFAELAEAGVFTLIADGFGWADATVVFEQLGRACVAGPLVGSFLAGDGRIAAVVERDSPLVVEHLGGLDAIIVLDGDSMGTLDPSTLSGETSDWPLDPLTPVTRVDDVPAATAVDGDAPAWRQRGALLTAAYCLGMADRLAETSVDYAKERFQFDRPIGSFQAIKHMLADMTVRVEVARAAVYAAAAHLDSPDVPGAPRAVSVAKHLAGIAALRNGKDATQVHGGMGFTWEVDVHLYLKRAWVLDTHFGSVDDHADLVAATL